MWFCWHTSSRRHLAPSPGGGEGRSGGSGAVQERLLLVSYWATCPSLDLVSADRVKWSVCAVDRCQTYGLVCHRVMCPERSTTLGAVAASDWRSKRSSGRAEGRSETAQQRAPET